MLYIERERAWMDRKRPGERELTETERKRAELPQLRGERCAHLFLFEHRFSPVLMPERG